VDQWVNEAPSFEGGDQLASPYNFQQISVSAMICTKIRRWSHSGPQHLHQGFAPALAASCCFILIGAASNNVGLTVTAGIVMIPAVLGIAKAVVFFREKEMGLLGISGLLAQRLFSW